MRPSNTNEVDMTRPLAIPPLEARRVQVDAYDFRAVHPHVRFGTASDRYAAWIGQIYPNDYASSVSERASRVGGRSFQIGKVPIASVRDYFAHFPVLEIDFTFYRPLLEADGEPSNTFAALQKYLDHAPEDARFLLKAPQQYFAPVLRQGNRFVPNLDYLDAETCLQRFHTPAVGLLQDRLAGVIFQQAYQRVGNSPTPRENIEALDAFFGRLPGSVQAHLELRSEHLLTPAYFDWLAARGLGFIFSYWTWLPPIREQWARCGRHFTAADGSAVARLLTPIDVKHAAAFAQAYPFDRAVPALSETKGARDMVLDAAALSFQAEAQDAQLFVIAANRAWGNAPDLARTIAHRILDEEERRAPKKE